MTDLDTTANDFCGEGSDSGPPTGDHLIDQKDLNFEHQNEDAKSESDNEDTESELKASICRDETLSGSASDTCEGKPTAATLPASQTRSLSLGSVEKSRVDGAATNGRGDGVPKTNNNNEEADKVDCRANGVFAKFKRRKSILSIRGDRPRVKKSVSFCSMPEDRKVSNGKLLTKGMMILMHATKYSSPDW